MKHRKKIASNQANDHDESEKIRHPKNEVYIRSGGITRHYVDYLMKLSQVDSSEVLLLI